MQYNPKNFPNLHAGTYRETGRADRNYNCIAWAAARQLETGKWTSKIGLNEEIEHDMLEDLAGPAYGHVTTFMKRNHPEKA